MTAKRYSDGTLAKWYYSQTNVISDGDKEYYLRNKESIKNWDYNELLGTNDLLDELNRLSDENEQLKKELKRCKDWLNSDKNDYQLTLAFIKNKGYSLKDVLEYEKELKE